MYLHILIVFRNVNLSYDSWNPSLRGAQRRGNPENNPQICDKFTRLLRKLAMTTFMFCVKSRISKCNGCIKQVFYFLLLSIMTTSAFAWDSTGHRLVAEIAYENLTPQAQKEVNALLQVPGPYYSHRLSFDNAAAWADWIRSDTDQYNALHYIDFPYCGDKKCYHRAVPKPNIVSAIQYDATILQYHQGTLAQQGTALRFYLHWLGDIHQPMHAINYYQYSKKQGDAGGNFYALPQPYNNLHAFWDDGAGLWPQDKKVSARQIKKIAETWQRQYPHNYFSQQLPDTDPMDWAKQSYELAIQYGYQATPNHDLSKTAQKNAQIICQQQIVLAGYRLAQNLNAWYARPQVNL